MANVRNIARRAGVSIATVSRVLNSHPQVSDDVRRRVLQAASTVGYTPSVGRRSNSNIAVLYTGHLSLGSPFDSSLLQGMSAGLQQHGYDLMILNARSTRLAGEPWAQLFLRKGIAGAVIRTDEGTRNLCREIAAEGVPLVVIADEFETPAIRCLGIDSRRAVRRAVEHLVHLGHQRIAITLNDVDDHDHRQRLETWKAVMLESRIGIDDRMILRVPAYRDAGAAALRQIMGMPNRPTAVLATDPLAAVGIFCEAHRLGVAIPRDLSVIGVDDSQQRYGVYPRMSAVCQDAEALGAEALSLLKKLIDGRNEPVASPTLECWLELNDSTAATAEGTRQKP